jgi:serine/threonine-protein kinase HipA
VDPLALDVRLDGFDDPVGVFVRDERGAVAFGYNRNYLAKSDAIPLSLSLPLVGAPYPDVAARAFFDNLLQERDDLVGLARRVILAGPVEQTKAQLERISAIGTKLWQG